MTDLSEILTQAGRTIPYRPLLKQLTGSVEAAILLQQVIYWWLEHKREPFYKFMGPCSHKRCQPGDSWQEELGFSRDQLNNALAKIGQKIHKGSSKREAQRHYLVLYWTDKERLTWFELNEPLLRLRLAELYNAANPHYISNAAKPPYLSNAPEPLYIDSERTTEMTPETPGAGARRGRSQTDHPLLAPFLEFTKLDPPPSKELPFWHKHLEQIKQEHGSLAAGLMKLTVDSMRQRELTIVSPKSLINPMRAEKARQANQPNQTLRSPEELAALRQQQQQLMETLYD